MTPDEQQEFVDREHLRLLRIGYLIGGAMNAAFACLPLIHVTFGLVMLLGGFPGKPGEPSPRLFGLLFVLIGGFFSLALATMAVLKLFTARRLRERRAKTFILVVAGLACFGFPYGTALGVCTFLVLARPSVDALFHPPPTSI